MVNRSPNGVNRRCGPCRAARRVGAGVVRQLGAGRGRRLGRRHVHLPAERLADHHRSQQLATAQLATREDESRSSATLLLVASSVTSLLGAGFALNLAGHDSGPPRALMIGVAVLTMELTFGSRTCQQSASNEALHHRGLHHVADVPSDC
jgi:hypothetical protein